MRKRLLSTVLCIALAAYMMMACSSGGSSESSDSGSAETAEDEGQVKTVRLAKTASGHIFNAIAEEQGYLEDEGIEVEYVDMQNAGDAFTALEADKVDVLSNYGTNLPLQYISDGTDLTIFAGYMLTGCMPIFTQKDTQWNGIEDMIGKTVACEPNMFAVSGPLLDLGYDPLNDITWLQPENEVERITAVEKGEADYGLVGTSLNYEVNNNDNIKVVAYASDLLPNYSCCRIEAKTSWVNDNPDTVKSLLKAWIRAQAYYEENHEEVVSIVCDLVEADEDFVRAYMDNEHYNLNIDPMKSSVVRAWGYMDGLGLLDDGADEIDIADHINVDLYKAALDECQEQYGDENPDFYEEMQTQYSEYNL